MRNNNILTKKSIAYFSGFGGIEIKHIEYGIDEIVEYVAGAWSGKKSAHRHKVYYTENGNAYFMHEGCRVPFNECIRM